jgi:ATP/maltotriose-dependent transcriptional regulator MalT
MPLTAYWLRTAVSRMPRRGRLENARGRTSEEVFGYVEDDGLSEREVLLMVARGMSNHQIAISLHLSEAIIKRHLANIYPRIGVSSRGKAVRKALSKKWISTHDIISGETQEA